MGLCLPPFAHELFELHIAALGQHDTHGREQIAFAVFGGKALAFEAEGAPAAGSRRDGELQRALERRHPHLGPERRLVERHRQIEPQVSAIEREDGIRRERHGDK